MPYDDMSIKAWIENISSVTSELPSPAVKFPEDQRVKAHGRKRQRRDSRTITQRALHLYPYPSPEPTYKRAKKSPLPADRGEMSDRPPRDIEATPRASSRAVATDQNLDMESPQSLGTAATFSSRSSVGTASSSKRSRRAASGSPTKRAFLRTIPRAINLKTYTESAVTPNAPLGFKELVDDIHDFALGLRTVPASLKAQLHDSERAFRRDDVFYEPSDDRSMLGHPPTLAEVDRVVRKACELSRNADSEAAWNCFVQAPLMALAEDYSTHSGSFSVNNIVHATISPDTLNPETQDAHAVRSRLVDFAFALTTNDRLSAALINLPPTKDDGIRSLNHTRFETLVDKPIVVSIETKSEGEDLQNAQTQLAVWAAAHLTRLKELLGSDDKTLPWLPLLIAQGPRWFFLFAQRTNQGRTDIWTKIEFGDASTRSGVFTMVRSQCLLRLQTEFSLLFRRFLKNQLSHERVVRVLDVGCGTGVPVSARLAEAKLDVYGIDISSKMLKLAQDRVKGTFHLADMCSYDLPPTPFDVILFIFSHLHLTYQEFHTTFCKFMYSLKPEGLLVIRQTPADKYVGEGHATYDETKTYSKDCSIDFMGKSMPTLAMPSDGLESFLRSTGLEIHWKVEDNLKPQGSLCDTERLARRPGEKKLVAPTPYPKEHTN